ncbi:hypothetical protein [Streptomyces umbrinus]|uniref:hypothetical protein n=1 Tax=Streptomyces umbrinus TaxID=67370 RepID=UPI003C2ABE82
MPRATGADSAPARPEGQARAWYDDRYVWIRDQSYARQAAAVDAPDLLDAAVRFVSERLPPTVRVWPPPTPCTATRCRSNGSWTVVAERRRAGIIRISGYADIEPQGPLGSPDGKKDVVVRRDGRRYVAAVYFPTTASAFAATRRKYKEDLRGR